MAQFTDGPVNICISVGILTKGWDFPPIDLVILDRATTSLPLYLQMIGRGSRTSPGKETFTVLDYGGNFTRHGLWDAQIPWDKKWNTKPKKREGVAPVKICPKCESIIAASVMICKFCNHVFEAATVIDDKTETKLIELTASYRTLIGKKISQLNPHELSLYARLKNKKSFAARVAKSQEQLGKENFLYDYAACMGYKNGWVIYNQPGTEKIEFHDIIIR
jgi:superfamily II DNA or RNA helicase